MLTSSLMLFVLLVTILLFPVLTSIPFAIALSMSLLRSWSSPLLQPIRSILSANHRLNMGSSSALALGQLRITQSMILLGWLADVYRSRSVSCIIVYRNKLNTMAESMSHCWTPTVVSKNSSSWLFKRTALLEFLYSAWMAWTRPPSMLKRLRICYRPACQALLNVFLKSMKLWNRSCWCCRCFSMMTWLLKIWSNVLRPGLKPCSSTSSSSSLGFESAEDNSEYDLAGMTD